MEALNYAVMLLFGGILLYVIIRPLLPAYSLRKKRLKLNLEIGHGVELMSPVKHDSYYFSDYTEFDEEKGILGVYTKKDEYIKLHFDDGIPFIPENLYAIRFRHNGQITIKYFDFDEIKPEED